MTEHHIAALCTLAGYAVTRVIPYGAFWRVYLHSDKGCTQATLDKRFGADSGLMSYGFGWDKEGLSIVVGERERIRE